MALPPIPIRPVFQTPGYGIRVAIYPSSDPTFDLELARSAASSAGSTYQTIARLGVLNGQGTPQYVDRTANDGNKRFYKARSVRDGWTPSSYTAVVSATPGILQERNVAALQFTGVTNTIPFKLSTSAVLSVTSSKGGAGFIQRSLRVPSAAFHGESTSDFPSFTLLDVRPSHVGLPALKLVAPLVVPPGVQVSGFSARTFRGSTKDSVSVSFIRISGDLANTVKTLVATGTTWATITSSAMLETVMSSRAYALFAQMNSTSATANARLQYVEVQYKRMQYHTAL